MAFQGIYADMLPNILSDIYSDILSAILSGILSRIYSGILSDIYSDIWTDILFWHSLCPGPGAAPELVQAQSTVSGARDMRSGGDYSDPELAVRVQRGTLRSSDCSWGPAEEKEKEEKQEEEEKAGQLT